MSNQYCLKFNFIFNDRVITEGRRMVIMAGDPFEVEAILKTREVKIKFSDGTKENIPIEIFEKYSKKSKSKPLYHE